MIKLRDIKNSSEKIIKIFNNEFIYSDSFVFIDKNTNKEIYDAIFPDEYSGVYIGDFYKDDSRRGGTKYGLVKNGKVLFYFDSVYSQTDENGTTIYILIIYESGSSREICILNSKMIATFDNNEISEFVPANVFLFDECDEIHRYIVKYDGRNKQSLLMNYKGEIVKTIKGFKAIDYFRDCNFMAVRNENCDDKSYFIYSLETSSIVSNDVFSEEHIEDLSYSYSNGLLKYYNKDGICEPHLKCNINNEGDLVIFRLDEMGVLTFEKKIIYSEQYNLKNIKKVVFENYNCPKIIPAGIRIVIMNDDKTYLMFGKDIISRTDIVKYDLMHNGYKEHEPRKVNQIRCFAKDGDVDILDRDYSNFIKKNNKNCCWSWRYNNLNILPGEEENITDIQW